MKLQPPPATAGRVPALARGIDILRLLQDGRPRRFKDIAARIPVPKASLTRLLQELVRLGLVSRDEATRAFAARLRLVPAQAAPALSDSLLDEALRRLSRDSGLTAEWYVPGEGGMVLVRRQEPPDREVSIRARVGFVRRLDGELDAVASLGLAAFSPDAPLPDSLWTYVRDGQRGPLSRAAASRRIDAARRAGASADPCFNSNGVRRCAALVVRGGAPVGILALAEPAAPGVDVRPDAHRDHLRACLMGLSEAWTQTPSTPGA